MQRALTAAIATGATALAYRRWAKPWQEEWGATAEERYLPLPGDDVVAEPAEQVTRAIEIDAAPEEVWPWIVQLGADRGGFYTYDLLENLFGLDIHNADEIVPEWQHLAVGDVVYGDRARTGGWIVTKLLPDEALVLQVGDVETGEPLRRDRGPKWEFSWTFALRPTPAGTTRLLVRERVAFGGGLMRVLMAPVGLVSFVMTRRMLIGIKQRVETGARAGTRQDVPAAV